MPAEHNARWLQNTIHGECRTQNMRLQDAMNNACRTQCMMAAEHNAWCPQNTINDIAEHNA
jgi:hypothetical protein